jgi:hypothetical protein
MGTGLTDGALPVAPNHSTAEGAHEQPYLEFVRLLKEDADMTKALIPAVVSLLEERIEHNDALVLPPGSKFVMNISIRDYMKRIEKYSGASPCCYAVGLIFLERLKSAKRQREDIEDGPLLTSATYQRLVVTSIMVAAKFLDDYYHSNKHWALIAGLPTSEINELELDFLGQLGYRLHIQREEYDWFAQELYERAERDAAINRFSELNLVSDDALSMMSTPPTSSMSIGHDSHQAQAQAHSKPYAIPSKAAANAAGAHYVNVPSETPSDDAVSTPRHKHEEAAASGRQHSVLARTVQEPVRHREAALRAAKVTTRVHVSVHHGGVPVHQGGAPFQAHVPQMQAPVLMGGYGVPVVQWTR